MSSTPTPLTRDYIVNMSQEELHKIMKNPARLAEVNAFLLTPEGRGVVAEIAAGSSTEPIEETEVVDNPVVEEFNQEEADRQAAEAHAAVAQAAAAQIEEARKSEEDQALIEAGITVYRDAVGNIVKLVQDYQATDEHGNAIGRSTHLEARSWIELVRKQKEAHVQATRAFHRLKDQKTTFTKKVVEPCLLYTSPSP